MFMNCLRCLEDISPAFTCSLGCGGGVLAGVVEYEKVGLPAEKSRKENL